MRRIARTVALCVSFLIGVPALVACTTVPTDTSPIPPATPIVLEPQPEAGEIAIPDPVLPEPEPDLSAPTERPTTPRTDPIPPQIIDVPPAETGGTVTPVDPEPVLEQPDPFAALDGWEDADLKPALAAFKRSCQRLLKRPKARPLKAAQRHLGTHGDWREVCQMAQEATNARPFFESLFVPVIRSDNEGLLTGYYEPEVEVQAEADEVFSEPILSVPTSDETRRLPRAELTKDSAKVIAFGRPIDVFFLHIQGSGRLHFQDGRTVRAAYAANNGRPYRSIGRILVQRGELTREQSAKRNIEAWMEAVGPEKARALMNENTRYIFFKAEPIPDGVGPRGAMQVPLTAMGSIAVDPKANPYGIPIWLDTRLPRRARDYGGYQTGLLAIAQDTGSAIKGPHRGDLFFGAGAEAGALAGVMKHPARWTVLIPRSLAEKTAPLS